VVTGIERDAYKLALARRLGATYTIVADRQDTVETVMELTGGRGVDVAVDTVPASGEVVIDAIACVRLGGRIVLAGLKGSGSVVPIETDRLITKSITIHGALSQPWSAYERGMDLLASDLENLSLLHTHEYPLQDAVTAISVLGGEHPEEECVSVTLNPAL
jgi:threonine dehydrogenase-like Zn-dependent dehydrogenase